MSDFSLNIKFTDIPEQQLEEMTQQMAGQLLLIGVRALLAAGETTNTAFPLRSYFALRLLYRGKFVGGEFGINDRVGREWNAKREATAPALSQNHMSGD